METRKSQAPSEGTQPRELGEQSAPTQRRREVSLSPHSGWPVNTCFKCDLYNKTLKVRGWHGAYEKLGRGVSAKQKQPLGA